MIHDTREIEEKKFHRVEYPSTATEARNAMVTEAQETSSVDLVVVTNEELLSALEKQVEMMNHRLEPVSARYSEPESDKAGEGPRGDSPLAQKLLSQTYRMRNLSDQLSRMTRELEI